MKVLALVMVFLAISSEKKRDAAATDPTAALAKSYGGRVWPADDEMLQKMPAPAELRGWLDSHASRGDLDRKEKDGVWSLSFVSVFKKPAARGPMTVELFDKTDPIHIVDQCSSENDASTLVFKGTCDLDPDHGFNKGHTYLVKVGQIIRGKFQSYAAGEVTLK